MTDRVRSNWKTAGLLCLAFLLPAGIMVIVCWSFGFYPFGEKSAMIMDMADQYAPFFSSLRDLATGESSVFFSWSKSMGTSYVGLFAYYLSSPLSFLLLLFPDSQLLTGILVLTVLKIALSGLTMAVYLRRMLQNRILPVLLLSTCYALMSYNLVYSLSVMWLDAVILLPVILLGIDWVIEKKCPLLLILSLAVMFIANYYTGYMIGIFSVCYFICRYFSRKEGVSAADFFRRGLVFAGSALLAAGLSAWLTIPTFLDLMQGKIGGNGFTSDKLLNYNFWSFFPKLLPGKYDSIQYEGMPSVFCGSVVLLLLLVFFCHRRIPVREKLLFGGLGLFLILSFWIEPLNVAWHAFQAPNWFPFRYAFVFSALLVIMAGRALGLVMDDMPGEKERHGSLRDKALFLASTGLSVVILTVSCGELGWNAKTMLTGLDEEFGYHRMADYQGFFDRLRPLVETAEQDDGFYRIEKTFKYSRNDALFLRFNGISHYSSTYNSKINNTLKQLGMAQSYFWNSYLGSTPVTDSLFGVRYIMSDTAMPGFYEPVQENDGVTLYRNPYALPIGFAASNDAAFASLSGYNYFETQNQALSSILGEEAGLFSAVPYERYGDQLHFRYVFTAPEDGPYYLSIASYQETSARVSVNGRYLADYLGPDTKHALFLGEFRAGESVEVFCEVLGNEISFLSEDIAVLDTDRYQAAMHNLQNGGLRITRQRNSDLTGTIDMDEAGCLVTSIPYDKGWTVRVDGEETVCGTFLDTFLLIPLSKGTHTVEFSYMPAGSKPGILISVLSFGLLAGIAVWRIMKKKKKIVKE